MNYTFLWVKTTMIRIDPTQQRWWNTSELGWLVILELTMNAKDKSMCTKEINKRTRLKNVSFFSFLLLDGSFTPPVFPLTESKSRWIWLGISYFVLMLARTSRLDYKIHCKSLLYYSILESDKNWGELKIFSQSPRNCRF